MTDKDPFRDAPVGRRYESVNDGAWLVLAPNGHAWVKSHDPGEWHGPSAKVYMRDQIPPFGWVPVERLDYTDAACHPPIIGPGQLMPPLSDAVLADIAARLDGWDRRPDEPGTNVVVRRAELTTWFQDVGHQVMTELIDEVRRRRPLDCCGSDEAGVL